MRDLTAHVTSGPLQFPEVTTQALGEDEITLESVLRGKFATGKNGIACLACGPQLEVVNSLTGQRLSAYRFSGVNEQPPVILAVKEFFWQKRAGLLIGIEDVEGSILCLYDLGISRVVKAVVLPGRVTAIEPIINHGGASASTQHLHPSLRWLFGVAAVVTDVGQVLLIDLCLDDLPCSQTEISASDLEVMTGIPAEVPHIRESVMQEGRHLCFQLVSPSGTAVSTLTYINRTNQLAVGFTDGYLALWNMRSMKREYFTQLEGGRVPVYAVTFQEPENDPRNCCYLWAVQSSQDSEGDVLSLHLLQLAFGDRKCLASGQILYEGLEYCEERYTLDLTEGIIPLAGQTNTKLLGCQSIEKFRAHGDREESMNEALSPDTSVSVFTWQVNLYGQGRPSVYLGLFDINRWYHAQMPDSLRSGEYLHNCSYFALWSLDSVVSRTAPHYILDVLVHERSLSRGLPPSYPPPEQFFNPSTYNFDATCLLNSGVVHITCTGFQKKTLTFLKKLGPSLNEVIPDSYNQCLVAGLLSPRLVDIQPSSLSQEEQLEAVLSAAVQTSSLGLLTGYIKRWTSEEQPNSAANLRFVLEWTWNKVVVTKEEFDRLCIPLFDGSCRFIDPQTIQSIQRCHLLLSNLNTVLSCFASEAQEITERGLMNLSNKYIVTQLICQYVQVVLWFCHSGLLPEGSDDAIQLSRLCYNYPVVQNYYTSCRQKCERLSRGKWSPDCLMIDGMVSQLGARVEDLWRRDEGGTGKYPPPSLHALLDIYLLDSVAEASKHAVTIYLLLDIIYSYPNKMNTAIESFPTVFAISWSHVKLIQGFWLIDHNDYENGLELLFRPATVRPMPWQHSKVIHAFMCQGQHRLALRYLQTMKPTVSTDSDVSLHLTVLLFNRCVVEAWSLLRQHCNRLNMEDLLRHTYQVCQEVGLMEDLLKLPFTDTEQERLVEFLQSSNSVQNQELLLVHHLQRANYIPALKLNQTLKINFTNDRDPRLRERSVVRNSILDQYGKILPRVQRKLAIERAKPYRLSSSVLREVSRPKPLSAFPKHAVKGIVVTRSAFISKVLSKVGEVWANSEPAPSIALYSSPKMEEPSPLVYSLPEPELPGAFFGTPVSQASQKLSRLLGLVVHPVPQPPQCLRFIQHSPARSPLCLEPSSLPVDSHFKGSQQQSHKVPELRLLESPLVVKKAKSLAMSVTSSEFAEFTPQSILRSGLRATPFASPSSSPGQSLIPLRLKEPRISFMEEGTTTKWATGAVNDNKTKILVTTPLRSVPAETEWPKSKDEVSLSVDPSGKGHQEMDVRVLGTPPHCLEKLDVSQENSFASVRSDQTILEYQDALSPGDVEDMFTAFKPVSSSAEVVANGAEQMKDDDRNMFETKVAPPELERQIGPSQEAETKELLAAGAALSDPNRPSPTHGVNTSLHVPSLHAREILTSKSKAPDLDLSVESSASSVKAAIADVLADSGRSGFVSSESPINSEHKLDQEIALNLKDQEIEVDVLKENVDLPEEKLPISDVPPETQEIHVTEHEKLEGSEQEAKVLSFNELYPSGTLKLQYNFDTIEQQFCDLPENKDSAESDIAEADGELFVAQSNFTLILEGEEGEVEAGDSEASNVLAKTTNTAAEEKLVPGGNNDGHEQVGSVPPVTASDQESHEAETLPCVPEPIKVAIAENLLDVIKDTRSKEMTSETAEPSIPENTPLVSRRVMHSTKLVSSTSKAVEEASSVTVGDVSPVSDGISSRTRTRARVRNLNSRSIQREESADVTANKTPKKSKKTREISEGPESAASDPGMSQNQQIPPTSVTPRRGRRRKEISPDTSESISAVPQEARVTPGRGSKKPKLSQLFGPANEETSFRKEEISSVTKKTPKRMKKPTGKEQSVEPLNDADVSKAASPRRSARKLRSAKLEASENTENQQDGKSSGQQLLLKHSKRVKDKETSGAIAIDSKADLSQTVEAELDKPATSRKRGRPKKVSPEAITPKVRKEEESPRKGEAVSIQRRSTRNTPATNKNKRTRKLALENSISVPNEELDTVVSPKKKLNRGAESQGQKLLLSSVAEERGAKGPSDEDRFLFPAALARSSRSTRTRSSKAIASPALSEPQNELLLSPALSEVPRKAKAKNTATPARLQDLVCDLSSQFVLSPTLRTRQKTTTSISRLTDKLVDDVPSVDGVGTEQARRTRSAKPKRASRNTEKETSWSPPPVKIKLISPLASPVGGGRSKPRKTAEVTGKAPGRGRKKPSSFPKQVLRRKML